MLALDVQLLGIFQIKTFYCMLIFFTKLEKALSHVFDIRLF